jgi:putative membrane protein
MSDTNTISKSNDKFIIPVIVALSIIVPVAVAALILFPDVFKLEMGIDRGTLPAFHATLNGITAILLILGLLFIRSKNIVAHRASMLIAFGLSAVFLVSYVISKLNADPISFGGDGALKAIYFFVLISHILLSIPVLPLAMFAIYRGWTGEIAKHKKVVRYTFPIWLYVAITGVLVYFFMAPYY